MAASYTRKGPGRYHRVGPGKRKAHISQDEIHPEHHLSPHAVREREHANALRAGDYIKTIEEASSLTPPLTGELRRI